VGFGIKTSEDAETIGRDADGVVVGTVLVHAIATSLDQGKATPSTVHAARDMVSALAAGAKRARG
jgi:tryptophan synthase alpha chain